MPHPIDGTHVVAILLGFFLGAMFGRAQAARTIDQLERSLRWWQHERRRRIQASAPREPRRGQVAHLLPSPVRSPESAERVG